MPADQSPKSIKSSRTLIAQLMEPEHANTQGNVHGGWIMKLVDEAGALTAMRHARHRAVTVAMDRMVFSHPIRIGDLVTLEAEVTYAGHTSMEIEVCVTAENPITGVRVDTNTAYLVYVAIDDAGKPVQVPGLVAETPEEQSRLDAARQRHQQRLAQRNNPD